MKTRFVLIHTSHAGNVGAAARAIKTMGFDDLVLVAPRWPDLLRREECIRRAAGAIDLIERARVVATLDQALDGVAHLCATAMTARDFGPPTAAPRAYFESLLQKERSPPDLPVIAAERHRAPEGPAPQASEAPGVAFLFGPERFGLSNDDVYRCHVALSIPANPHFGSLNLGAAVQLIAYEWRQALGGFAQPDADAAAPARTLADAAQLTGMLAHWQQALTQIGFLDPAAPKKLMPRLNQLFNRAQLAPEEIHILRGVAKAMIELAQAKR